LQGFPVGWTLPEPEIALAENELDSLRYAALGNAVCVPVVEWIAGRIVSESAKEATKDLAAIDLLTPFPTDQPKSYMQLGDVGRLKGKFKWTSGGYAWGNGCVLTSVSPAPVRPITRLFVDVLENDGVSEGHFLSPNAAEGILRRVRGQRRTLFAPLDEALQRLAGASLANCSRSECPIGFSEAESEAEFLYA